MKLKDCFITHNVDDQQIMVATDNDVFKGIVKSNATAALIVDTLKQDVTREQIISAMLEEYDVDEETAGRDVDRILEKLRGIGAIDG